MPSTTSMSTFTPEPIVRLQHYFQDPYNLAVATARTCYSPTVISPEDVDKDDKAREQRDRIAESIYRAGHHTTIQHPHFQFVLEKVSRQFIWSFLHAHPFYNCLAGETEIPHFHVANKAPWTIAELYQRLHSSDKHTYVEKMHVRSVDEHGNLVPNRIRNVVATGRQPVFKVKTALGYIIRATREHRFMRESKSWARLHELSVGDEILVNGVRVYKDRNWLKQRYHAESPHRSIMRVTVDRIISIEADGDAETYDLVMEAPFHNFVANGFIVHNSEQVSQRYVEVKPENFTVPPLDEPARALYLRTVHDQMEAYHALSKLVEPTVTREYQRLFPLRRLSEKRWASAVKKRCQEVARYCLPVATHAHLYHTISGITLHRYWRLCQQMDVPLEQRFVIQKMVDEVCKVDPKFMALAEEPIALEQTLEYQTLTALHRPLANGAGRTFVDEFDHGLGGATSKLVDYKLHGQETMAQAVRSVLGLSRDRL
ncbi:MAG: FAD-dependent thymidylate synthase, partial [Candidatus Omnitrophica bacterium]|nr:FAD-dependent thymidylate synthase [Candidatus Omnitrophota bacterium]